MKNRSEENTYTVTGSLHVETVLYTGKQREKVKSETFDIKIKPKAMELIEMEVTFHEYFKRLMDQVIGLRTANFVSGKFMSFFF